MKKPRHIAYSHPTTVCCVDDNEHFLHGFERQLKPHTRLVTCTKADQALAVIRQSEGRMNQEAIQKLDYAEDENLATYFVGINLASLLSLIYRPKRCEVISVAIIDYEMPDMNGVELAEQLAHTNVGKIILTAEADESLAVAAFNQGIIDQFIPKTADSAKLEAEVLGVIESLKQLYFQRLSKTIINNLGQPLSALLNDVDFQALFHRVYVEANAVEYYLVDEHGSYLFLDKDANPTWLIVRDEEAIWQQITHLEEMDMPTEIVEQLKNKQKLLFMPSEKDHQDPSGTLTEYLFDVDQLNDHHFYSIAQGRITKLVDWEKVRPCGQP